jgi:hypothetical protein
MTPKISVITAVAVAALTVGAPAAFGEGRLAGSQEPVLAVPDPMIEDGFAQAVATSLALQSASTYREPFERGAVAKQSEPQWLKALKTRSEALNRKYGLGEFSQGTASTTSPEQRALRLRSEALNRQYGLGEYGTSTTSDYRDAFERAVPQPESPQVVPTASGRDIEWPQIGVGLVVGMIFVLGVGLAMRMTPIRPAH